MPTLALKPASTSKDLIQYSQLRRKIEETLLTNQRKIESLKVRTYWQTGRYINEHIRLNNSRADYGKKVLLRLAQDLDLEETVLIRCASFARTFPKIPAARQELTWAHYRTLATVTDGTQRMKLVKEASDQKLSSRDLEIKVRDLKWSERSEKKDGESVTALPRPAIGPFFTYRIIRPEVIHSKSNELLIDLGFSTTIEVDRFSEKRFKPETIIQSAKSKEGSYSVAPASPALGLSDLYTYKAFVERVIDGDTIKVEFDLGFNIRMRQTIRLKSIDAPELDTAEGRRAKQFVEDELKGRESIMIKSTKHDKYDRYLGDIFLTTGKKELVYLNQLLIDRRFAVRVRR